MCFVHFPSILIYSLGFVCTYQYNSILNWSKHFCHHSKLILFQETELWVWCSQHFDRCWWNGSCCTACIFHGKWKKPWIWNFEEQLILASKPPTIPRNQKTTSCRIFYQRKTRKKIRKTKFEEKKKSRQVVLDIFTIKTRQKPPQATSNQPWNTPQLNDQRSIKK